MTFMPPTTEPGLSLIPVFHVRPVSEKDNWILAIAVHMCD